MDKKLSICVVTGSRADYSHLFYPLKCIAGSSKLHLQLVVTAMHLSHDFGYTVELVKKDGFIIAKEVPMLLPGDDSISVTKSIGNGVIKFADVFSELSPDVLLILGDRFEMLAVAQCALVAGIPIAHIGGGDVTEGAFDDAIRHSITKMSAIHFATNNDSMRRILKMGENPVNVYNVGAPSLDIINKFEFLCKKDFLKSVGIPDTYSKYILLTYHPETISDNSPANDIKIILDALSEYKDTGIIITGANADTGGKTINNILHDYANKNENAVFHMSLGKDRFYNALKHIDIFVGNSSSGLYEAPSFKLPVVNIGDRQKNRLSAESIINCILEKKQIVAAINKAFALDCSNVINPYGDGTASQKIVQILEKIKEPKKLLRKTFYN